MSTQVRERFQRLVVLVDKEDHRLAGVRHRLLGDDCAVTRERIDEILQNDIGSDRLESFGAKFGRMQDTVVDKLVPAILSAAGEPVAAAIDNLARLERLALIDSADDWLAMRSLRNLLVYEYIDSPERLAPTLEKACRFTGQMHTDYAAMREYVTLRFGVM